MYIEKTTADERRIISNSMIPIFSNLERAESLLNEIREGGFDYKGSSVKYCGGADWMSEMLGMVGEAIYDAIASFYLTIGQTDNYHAKYYLECLRQAEGVAKCESVLNRIMDAELKRPAERRKKVMDSRKAVTRLDDEEALPILEKLLSEIEADKQKSELCSHE